MINQNIWVLGGFHPEQASFNTWSLFEFLQDQHPEIRSYYILSDQADGYQEAVEQYGEAILTYQSKEYIKMLIRARILITSAAFQRFYPIPSPAFHKRVKAKKVFLPASMLGLSQHLHTFNQLSGLSPAHLVITQSDIEAEHVNVNLGYNGDRILISGTALLDRFLREDGQQQSKHTLLLLPDSQLKQTLQSFLSLAKSRSFQRLLHSNELTAVIALDSKDMADFKEEFEAEQVKVIEKKENHVYQQMTQAALLVSNQHPWATTFALSGRPLVFYRPYTQAVIETRMTSVIPLGKTCQSLDEVILVVEDQAKRGFIPDPSVQIPRQELIEFNDQSSNQRIFEILVEQL